MSLEAKITQSHGWHRHEKKTIRIAIEDDAGAPVNLTSIGLRWLLLRGPGGVILLEKTSEDEEIGVEGDDDEVAAIAIEVEDYASLDAGNYYHELWDIDTPVLLAFGDAILLPGTAPGEES